MGARELPAGAIVVDHEVVGSEHAGVGEDLVVDVLDELGAGGLAQKRAHRVSQQPHAAPADERAHGEARPSVKVYARRP